MERKRARALAQRPQRPIPHTRRPKGSREARQGELEQQGREPVLRLGHTPAATLPVGKGPADRRGAGKVKELAGRQRQEGVGRDREHGRGGVRQCQGVDF